MKLDPIRIFLPFRIRTRGKNVRPGSETLSLNYKELQYMPQMRMCLVVGGDVVVFSGFVPNGPLAMVNSRYLQC